MLLDTISEIYSNQNRLIRPIIGEIQRDLITNIDITSSFIIIISGMRRVGKSVLLRQLIRAYNKNTCFYNFEDHRNTSFVVSDFDKLLTVFNNQRENEAYFFDEIQNIDQWENFIRTIHDQGIKIYITGSNASLLSRELGTKLTGRHITYELFPFSYSEFVGFNNVGYNIDTFSDYMHKGGIAGYLQNENDDYLQQLFSDIIIRDIVVRYNLRNTKTIKELGLYLISNTGKQLSYGNLRNIFDIGSTNSVAQYISYFLDSYILFEIPKFNYSLKKQSVNPKKIYSIDTALSRVNTLSFSKDKGRVLENVVFLFLRRKYKEIYYFQGKGECDFVVKYKGEIIYAIQVTYELHSDNMNRELNGVIEAMDFFKLNRGLIITMNQEDKFTFENKVINAIPAWKWMKDKE